MVRQLLFHKWPLKSLRQLDGQQQQTIAQRAGKQRDECDQTASPAAAMVQFCSDDNGAMANIEHWL
jgi:hypothetical protein